MSTFASTIPKIRDALQATFRSGLTRPLPWRQHQLYQLARMAQNERELICDALQKDLGKPKTEVLVNEVGSIVERAVKCAKQLPEWAKTEYPDVPDRRKSWRPTIYKAPKGTALIISPWNYPMILSFQPLMGAIAAGCTAILKPSELLPTFSQLLEEIVPKYLDPNAYRVVNGAVPETTKLLELQWDHIFYTGNGKVARIVASAAAKHLTPLTLELGGKSPVIIDSAYDIDLAAKRILWGKCNNAGQICVAPDYVLVQRDKQDELVKAFQKHYNAFFPKGALDSPLFGSIVSDSHYKRLTSLLSRTKGEVVLQGRTDAARRRLEPTIVKNVVDGDSLLEEEIFGPILPIVPVDSLQQAINFVNARSHPLVLYAFSENESLKQQLVSETQSGGIVFNDTFQQLAVSELPFTGVGESGYGYQFMKHTYDTFTQLRSSIDMPKEAEADLAMRYPPHSEEAVRALTAAVYKPIPASRL
ncbi:aldehyde dehydrogenase [Suillus subalutaceus]|uniref:aldehyde dehydrogenase n=1 Tax=Suillus subalutaceus TaxID=48586 RepID=UPI001B86A40F|nr:aldehyde dehydrogenase [Suillus subalutaceus]KAG1869415.1 aldehyde dehydrogenase [Suillus subalutaceus]